MALLLVSQIGQAQFYSVAEAESAEEFDAWLELKSLSNGTELRQEAAAFLKRWPQSRLLAGVHQLLAEAERAQGSAQAALRHARESLRSLPENPTMLLLLAEYGSKEERSSALTQARRALRNFPPPPGAELEEWRRVRERFLAKCDEVEALHQAERGNITAAARLLEAAAQVIPDDMRTQIRLGKIRRALGDKAGARLCFALVLQQGDASAKQLAEAELAALEKP